VFLNKNNAVFEIKTVHWIMSRNIIFELAMGCESEIDSQKQGVRAA
jgi:hypothetical protein